MKTIGSYLKSARKDRRLTIQAAAEETRIKEAFIKAIEEEQWEVLPEFPVVVGFVKNLASYLEIDRNQAVALLRRDYPPKKNTPLPPKKDISREFNFGPRMVFVLGVMAVILLVLGYLVFQYSSFMKPPALTLTVPEEGQIITTTPLSIVGTTTPGATVSVNNQPVIVEEDGSFITEVEVSKDTKEIVVKSASRSGKEVEVRRSINVNLK